MPSPTPLLYDTYYHIYNRGTDRGKIFFEERNFIYFLNLYAKQVEPLAETFAYCLLNNHFHLLVRIKSEEEIEQTLTNQTLKVSKTFRVLNENADRFVSRQFSVLFSGYAKAINKAYGRTGSLFQHPFGRVQVTNDHQFSSVIAYIHQNPQKHKLIDDFRDWKWSSYASILSDKPTRLNRQKVLDWFGGRQAYLELNSEWISEAKRAGFAEDDEVYL